nr:hypothetical protein BaRGS_003058 [Batillaria attramentaria]
MSIPVSRKLRYDISLINIGSNPRLAVTEVTVVQKRTRYVGLATYWTTAHPKTTIIDTRYPLNHRSPRNDH